jgi:hypothetical protein
MNQREDFTGYSHPDYAHSLTEFGEPLELPACGGWVLVRPIPGFPAKDAMGCYPLFSCQDFSKIGIDLEKLKRDLVSLVLVTDPFIEIEPQVLAQNFDIAKPYKKHFIVDLTNNFELTVPRRTHKQYARKSLRDIRVEIILRPEEMLDEWFELYQNLIARHNITGIQAFSKTCFAKQLQLPGLFMAVGRMNSNNDIVGILLLINHGNHAYAHLIAVSQIGYSYNASYGLYWEAFKYLESIHCQYCWLGAAAGINDDPTDGLSMFKKGWSSSTRLAYLCGKIINREMYNYINKNLNKYNIDYFPTYRAS